jgi:hypothetical protein
VPSVIRYDTSGRSGCSDSVGFVAMTSSNVSLAAKPNAATAAATTSATSVCFANETSCVPGGLTLDLEVLLARSLSPG